MADVSKENQSPNLIDSDGSVEFVSEQMASPKTKRIKKLNAGLLELKNQIHHLKNQNRNLNKKSKCVTIVVDSGDDDGNIIENQASTSANSIQTESNAIETTIDTSTEASTSSHNATVAGFGTSYDASSEASTSSDHATVNDFGVTYDEDWVNAELEQLITNGEIYNVAAAIEKDLQ